MPVISHGDVLAPEEIRTLEYEIYKRSPWGSVISDITVGGRSAPDGVNQEAFDARAVITRVRDLEYKGGDTVYSPLVTKLEAKAIWGDAAEDIGDAGTVSLYPNQLFVNAVYTFTPITTGPMSALRFKKAGGGTSELTLARRVLRDWFSEEISRNIISYSFYNGYSAHVALQTDGSGNNTGLNKGKRFCPNIHVAGTTVADTTSGWVDWSATHNTYMGRIGTALTAMKAEGQTADNGLSAALLDKIKAQLLAKEFPFDAPNPFGFEQCAYILMHPDVFVQAMRDPEIRQVHQTAFTGKGYQSTVLGGRSLYYNGFLLIESQAAGTEVHVSNSGITVAFGPVNASWNATPNVSNELDWHGNYASVNADDRILKASLILNSQSLVLGQAGSLVLNRTNLGRDSSRAEYLSGQIIAGASRADYYDSLSNPTAVKNNTSAVLITYSPALS